MDATEVMRRALAAEVGKGLLDDGSVAMVGGIRGSCQVVQINQHGAVAVVELHLALTGGPFGDRWVIERWGGVGSGVDDAITQGVSDWSRVAYRALARALDGSEPSFRAEVHGAGCRVYADDVMLRGPADEIVHQLPQGSPCAQVLAHPELMPLLAPGRAHLITCFAARPGDGEPVIEVSIDGAPWPPAGRAFAPIGWSDRASYVSFRQTAVVFVDGAPRLERASVEATWRGLASRDPHHDAFGAASHRYRLAPPLDEAALAALRARGVTLPEDYERFVTTISAGGAGPYHGLLPPHAPSQIRTAVGRFPHRTSFQAEDEDDDRLVAGTLSLAHIGCGYFSFLVLDGPARGEVWADVRYAQQGLVVTHDSFDAWYLDAIDAAVRGQAPSLPADPARCALPHAISSFARSLEAQEPGRELRDALAELTPGAIRTTAEGESARFDPGDGLALCPACSQLADRLGIPPEAIVPGDPPKPWREALADDAATRERSRGA